jgi:hypothetical protein
VTRREVLATVKTLEHFHKYLQDQQFHLHTDHSVMTWLFSFKNFERQTVRWVQGLQEYIFTSEHSQGRKHSNAEALSRRPYPEECSHGQKFKRDGGLRVRVVTAAAADGWGRASKEVAVGLR